MVFLSITALTSESFFMPSRVAWGQTSEHNALSKASDLYEQGKFREASDLLKVSLDKGQIATGDVQRAKELLARCWVKLGGMVAEAHELFLSMLRQDPSYRPDPIRVPPDEYDVFDRALHDFQAEKLKAEQRIPASIGGFGGWGFPLTSDFTDRAEAFNQSEGTMFDTGKKNAGEFGGSVRLPLRPRWSLDLELSHLEVRTHDSNENADFTMNGMPLVASAYYSVLSRPKQRVNAFLGAGPMLSASIGFRFRGEGDPSISATYDPRTGVYIHGGIEGEYLWMKRLAIGGRLLGRYAQTRGSNVPQPLDGMRVDFTGFAIHLGARAYIGY